MTLGLTVYILVALLNYSLVQSYVGALAGAFFSSEWGGKVRIGSLKVMPFDHFVADDLLWVSPTGDTLLVADRLSATFDGFPFEGNSLNMDQVYLGGAYYHFATANHKTNLQFLIDYFRRPRKKKHRKPFTVNARELILDGVHYKMDLPDRRRRIYPYGVQIPHMEFYDIKARIKDIKVVKDDVTCRIEHMSTRERSGFLMKHLSGNIHVSPHEIVAREMVVKTRESLIVTDATLRYNGWKGMKGYVSTVQHEAELKRGTHVSMRDVAYWAPVLWGIDAEAEAEGKASGTIDSLVTDMRVAWGTRSHARVTGSVTGLPKIDTTVFDVTVTDLETRHADLEPLEPFLAGLSPYLAAAGDLQMDIRAKGGIKEMAECKWKMDCALGEVDGEAKLQHTAAGYRFALDVASPLLKLTPLTTLNTPLSHAGFNLKIDGRWHGGFKETHQWERRIAMEMEATLRNVKLNAGNHSGPNDTPGDKKFATVAPIKVQGHLESGQMTAFVACADSVADLTLEATASLNDSLKRYNLVAEIENFDVGLLPKSLSTRLTASLHGNNLEEMCGSLAAEGTRWGTVDVGSLRLNIESDKHGKELELESDLADAALMGRFAYSDIPSMIRHFANLYLPDSAATHEESESSSIKDNTLSFKIKWKDPAHLLQQWTSSVAIAPGTLLDGSYNYGEQLKLVGRSDSLKLGPLKLENVGLTGHPSRDRYILQLEAQSLSSGHMELIDRLSLTLASSSAHASLGLRWGGSDAPTRGDILLSMTDGDIKVVKPDFYIGSNLWKLSARGFRLENEGRLGVVADELAFASDEQMIKGHLSLLGKSNDCLELHFDRFNLFLVSQLLLEDTPVDVEGYIEGRFSLYGLTETPYFNASLTIDSCVVNQQMLGVVRLASQWNAEMNILNLQLGSRQLRARGWIGLEGEERDINFNVDFNQLELALAAPLLQNFSSRFEGQLDGNLDITGSIAHPVFGGEGRVENGALKIDITGVTYHFADTLLLHGNTITLNNFEIEDPQGHTATIDGNLKLTAERKILVDLALETPNLLVLNQPSGDIFYGRLLASATGRVTGSTSHLDIDISARTNPGCELTIPVSMQQRVKSQNYITFISDHNDDDSSPETERHPLDYDLSLDLAVTPDAKLNIPMDFQEVTVNVGASGSGDLHLTLGGNQSAQMMGSYELTSGTMRVGLLSVYEKKFSILSGSNLQFQGSLPEARFDLGAVYSQRVNMSTLTGTLSSVDNTQKYLQVENIINIAGTLREPKINFDLRLPNADQSVEEEVFSYIDRNSERDMLNQTLSLLVSGSFYNVNNDSPASGNPIDIVTSFVGNSLSDMVQFIDLNIDYRSATDVTNQQIDLNISKDWGRWYLESTLGYGGESRDLDASSNTGAIIDALIGYRLSPLFHLYAYNRTNTNDYTRIDLPYKQGAGLKLTKDFDNWLDLFGLRKHSKKR